MSLLLIACVAIEFILMFACPF